MYNFHKQVGIAVAAIVFLSSCSTIEKASMHGLNSGYYNYKSEQLKAQKVYVDVTDEKMDVYPQTNGKPEPKPMMSIPLMKSGEGTAIHPMIFKKQELDIDITSILLKYRPSVYGLPAQMTTDLNIALYAGWRHDYFYLRSNKDPLGRVSNRISNRGFDFGVFAGPGTTFISPFTTRNHTTNEYSAMVLQSGFAAFIESNVASFGFAVGFDYLLNTDRSIWIYHNKPWVGFVVGVALN